MFEVVILFHFTGECLGYVWGDNFILFYWGVLGLCLG
jgi:hypothetical protein